MSVWWIIIWGGLLYRPSKRTRTKREKDQDQAGPELLGILDWTPEGREEGPGRMQGSRGAGSEPGGRDERRDVGSDRTRLRAKRGGGYTECIRIIRKTEIQKYMKICTYMYIYIYVAASILYSYSEFLYNPQIRLKYSKKCDGHVRLF